MHPDEPTKSQLRTPQRIKRIWRVRWQDSYVAYRSGERRWKSTKSTTFTSEKEYKDRIEWIFKHEGLRLLGAWTAEVTEWEKLEFPELRHQAVLHA